MRNDPNTHRTAGTIFTVVLMGSLIGAFVMTFRGVDTKSASNEAQPGTIGLARPHAPLDRAPGQPVRN
jgi:hypothetical protein